MPNGLLRHVLNNFKSFGYDCNSTFFFLQWISVKSATSMPNASMILVFAWKDFMEMALHAEVRTK